MTRGLWLMAAWAGLVLRWALIATLVAALLGGLALGLDLRQRVRTAGYTYDCLAYGHLHQVCAWVSADPWDVDISLQHVVPPQSGAPGWSGVYGAGNGGGP